MDVDETLFILINALGLSFLKLYNVDKSDVWLFNICVVFELSPNKIVKSVL